MESSLYSNQMVMSSTLVILAGNCLLRISRFMLSFRKAGSHFSFHGGRFAALVYATACLHQPGLSMSGQIDYKGEARTRVMVNRR
jgi:hypothetical protein